MINNDKLLTPPQVAQRLQVNERTVTQWLRRGHLRGFKIGKEWRVSAHDLDAFWSRAPTSQSASSASKPFCEPQCTD